MPVRATPDLPALDETSDPGETPRVELCGCHCLVSSPRKPRAEQACRPPDSSGVLGTRVVRTVAGVACRGLGTEVTIVLPSSSRRPTFRTQRRRTHADRVEPTVASHLAPVKRPRRSDWSVAVASLFLDSVAHRRDPVSQPAPLLRTRAWQSASEPRSRSHR